MYLTLADKKEFRDPICNNSSNLFNPNKMRNVLVKDSVMYLAVTVSDNIRVQVIGIESNSID